MIAIAGPDMLVLELVDHHYLLRATGKHPPQPGQGVGITLRETLQDIRGQVNRNPFPTHTPRMAADRGNISVITY